MFIYSRLRIARTVITRIVAQLVQFPQTFSSFPIQKTFFLVSSCSSYAECTVCIYNSLSVHHHHVCNEQCCITVHYDVQFVVEVVDVTRTLSVMSTLNSYT